MRVDAFTYELPEELIAQRPAAERESARLCVVLPHALEHHVVRELPELLPDGALLVVNDTRVVPARLLGHRRPSGGKVEIFLVRQEGSTGRGERWRALGRASKTLRPDTEIEVGALTVRVLTRHDDGTLDVELESGDGRSVRDLVHALGHVPLPPYIARGDDADDAARYQTVFARVDGAVAAPTAGLHLTAALLARHMARAAAQAAITLHVGLGTFQPVTAEDLDDHPMHAEFFEVSEATAHAIAAARKRGAPVVAVGTTVARALESAADRERPGLVVPQAGETRLLIQPGYRFRVVDRLLTNFHLPRSTLLAMVCAFAGTERILEAYAACVRDRYRFFSYGDAMLVAREPRTP